MSQSNISISYQKNWISQGLVADKTVVIADLRVDDKSYGPHAFMMDLRINGKVVQGISHGDMGKKTVGNDLDNAWISFENVHLPKSSMLNKYADIIDNKYVQTIKGMPIFHMVGQRLFTGRIVVAQGAIEFRKKLFAMTEVYANNKFCWSPSGNEVPLSSLPQLKSLFNEEKTKTKRIEKFIAACELELTQHLKNNSLPDLHLVEAIAAIKVLAVEESIDLSHRLKNEVGSYALMSNTGFENCDYLICCKFAEGDSRILMQKMSRDRIRLFSKSVESKATELDINWDNETQACYRLTESISKYRNKEEGWNSEYKQVYSLRCLSTLFI